MYPHGYHKVDKQVTSLLYLVSSYLYRKSRINRCRKNIQSYVNRKLIKLLRPFILNITNQHF